MVVHWDILLCKLFIFMMLRIFNWWMISNVDQMLFFLFFLLLIGLVYFFFYFFLSQKRRNVKYLIHARLPLWENSHFPGRNIHPLNLYLNKTYLPVCLQIVRHGWNKCSELRWVLTNAIVYSVSVTVQLISDGERTWIIQSLPLETNQWNHDSSHSFRLQSSNDLLKLFNIFNFRSVV